MSVIDFLPDELCGDVFAAHRHGTLWTYTCVRPNGHIGLCRDRDNITWLKGGEG